MYFFLKVYANWNPYFIENNSFLFYTSMFIEINWLVIKKKSLLYILLEIQMNFENKHTSFNS